MILILSPKGSGRPSLLAIKLKKVILGLFDAYVLKLTGWHCVPQQVEDGPTKILGRRHPIYKERIEIEIDVIETIDHFSLHCLIQRNQIHNHACLWANLSADQYFNEVIVAVPARVIALAIGDQILFIRKRLAMQAVAG